MKTNSKILFFSIAVILVYNVISCRKDNTDVIPDVYIDFTLDLQDPEFAALLLSGSSDTIDASTRNLGSRAAGFDGNGIIIYTGPDEFFAYDRTCPYDYAINNLSIKVKVNFSQAECPHCGTIYSLAAFGSRLSGSGQYPLKNYNTGFEEERFLRVWNK
jgi:nitrite reductase/ring-hydroxylating ferredoxin subunit